MKIAIPTHGRNLTAHFGHCESFAIVQVEDNNIQHIEFVDPPEHRPGVYPRFLANAGVDVIIAGGMGQKARQLFSQNGIQVVVGISEGKPEELVKRYLDENLRPGENLCDH